jgi:alpha-beta hydrolase superfamily lysophospholipase
LNVDKIPEDFPILVIAGGKDGVFKTSSLAELFPKFGSKELDVNIFPERGHLLLEHQEVNQDIAAVFDRWLTHQTGAEEVVQSLH